MRSPLQILLDLAVVRDISARGRFDKTIPVTIHDPEEFLAAVQWCRAKWEEQQQHYRIVEGSRRLGTGTFEFADETHACEFKLKFG